MDRRSRLIGHFSEIGILEGMLALFVLSVIGAAILIAIRHFGGKAERDFLEDRIAKTEATQKALQQKAWRKHQPLLPEAAYDRTDFHPDMEFFHPATRLLDAPPEERVTVTLEDSLLEVRSQRLTTKLDMEVDEVYRIIVFHDAPTQYGWWQVALRHGLTYTFIAPSWVGGLETFVELGRRCGFDAMAIYNRTNKKILRDKKGSFEDVVWEKLH